MCGGVYRVWIATPCVNLDQQNGQRRRGMQSRGGEQEPENKATPPSIKSEHIRHEPQLNALTPMYLHPSTYFGLRLSNGYSVLEEAY